MKSVGKKAKGPKPNRVYESMTRYTNKLCAIRVWRNTYGAKPGPDEVVLEALHRVMMLLTASKNPSIFAVDRELFFDLTLILLKRHLEKIEGIAAYEVLDLYGNGVIVYPDWN